LNKIAKGGGFSNHVPGKAALDIGRLPKIAESWRVWSSLVWSSAAMQELEPVLPESAM